MERASRLFYGLAAILFLTGFALRLLPASTGNLPGAGRAYAAPAVEEARGTAARAGQDSSIVERNLFSSSRRPPGSRYNPPDLAPAAEPFHRVRVAHSGLRLLGIVSGSSALVEANPAVPGAEIYQVGDVIDGKRLVAILDSTVVLVGPTGRTLLKLQQRKPPTSP